VAKCGSVLRCVHSVFTMCLQCVAVCRRTRSCSGLQFVAVCCRGTRAHYGLHCVALCCIVFTVCSQCVHSVLQCVGGHGPTEVCVVLNCVAVCLQCV